MKSTFCAMLISLLLPIQVFAGVGAAGSVDTVSATVFQLFGQNSVALRASAYTPISGALLVFEYGPTPDLGRRTQGYQLGVGNIRLVDVTVYNLTPGVEYFYRAVIESTAGSVFGETKTFIIGGDDRLYTNGQTSGGAVTTNGTNSSGGTGTVGTGSTGGVLGGTGNTASVGNAFSGNSTGSSGNETGEIFGTNGGVGGSAFNTAIQNPGGFFQRLFDSVIGERPLQVSIQTNPEKASPREIVEYTVTYANESRASVSGGTLGVLLPNTLVYLGDNSGGKGILSQVEGGQKLTFSTEALSGGNARTVSIMTIATNDVGKIAPYITVELVYRNAKGTLQRLVTTGESKATSQTATVSQSISQSANAQDVSTGNAGILPSSVLGWIIFLVITTGIIVLVRKVMATYQERKKKILEEASFTEPRIA